MTRGACRTDTCVQMAWVGGHVDHIEAPLLRRVLLIIFSLVPSAAAAERNWSVQDFIFSRRRNRLDGARGTQLVYIYFNTRSLARRVEQNEIRLAEWRERSNSLERNTEFPHHPKRDWAPFSNWEQSARGAFEGMHGDQNGRGEPPHPHRLPATAADHVRATPGPYRVAAAQPTTTTTRRPRRRTSPTPSRLTGQSWTSTPFAPRPRRSTRSGWGTASSSGSPRALTTGSSAPSRRSTGGAASPTRQCSPTGLPTSCSTLACTA